MDDWLGLICVLAVVVTVMTVVGHGLWLLAALVVKAMFAAGQPPSSSVQRCAACGHPEGVKGGRCQFCGASESTKERPAWRNDLDATARQLESLRQQEAISQQQHETLLEALRSEFARLSGDAPPAAPSSAEVQPTPAATSPTEMEADSPFAPARPTTPPVPATTPPAESLDEVVLAAEIVDDTAPSAPPTPPTPAMGADRDETPTEPVGARRTLANILQAFMEEKNIRWGELISGLLIVVSAIGLVISLRATLNDWIPYFPALLFMLGTGAIHATGQYTLRRWNLRSTSRGMLIIGMLLVPLSVLAAIFISESEAGRLPVSDPRFIAAMTIGLIGFATMTVTAARTLLPRGWWHLTIGVMGASIGQLLINRLVADEADLSAGAASWLTALPLASFLLAALGQIGRASRSRQLSAPRAERLFMVLGITGFALLVPLALLLAKADNPITTLARISPALSLAAGAVLGAGLLVHSRVTQRQLAATRTVGTSLAIGGGLLMVVMVAFAWPYADLLIGVGLVNFTILVVLATLGGLVVLHAAAIACLALAYLVGFHQWQGNLPDGQDHLSRHLLQTLAMGRSGAALTGLAALVAATGGVLVRGRRRLEAVVVLWSGAGIAATAVLVALYAGFVSGVDDEVATPVMLIFAAVLLVWGRLARWRAAAWSGSVLLLASSVHLLAYNDWAEKVLSDVSLLPHRPLLVAALAHGVVAVSLSLLVSTVMKRRRGQDAALRDGFIEPLSYSALISSALTMPSILWVLDGRYTAHACYAACVALVWLGAAVTLRRREIFAAFQALATVAVLLGGCAAGVRLAWWDGSWNDTAIWPLQLALLGIWCAVWPALRRLALKWPACDHLLQAKGPTVDQFVLTAAVCGIVVLTTLGCAAGVAMELGIGARTETTSASDFFAPAHGSLAWAAMGLIAAALLSALRERVTTAALTGLIVALVAVPLLIAARFEPTAAVASALRWTLAIYGGLAAIVLCLQSQITVMARRAKWLRWDMSIFSAPAVLRSTALALSAAPVIALTSWVLLRVAVGMPPEGPAVDSIFDRAGSAVSYAAPMLLVVATLLAYAIHQRSASFVMAGSLVFQYFVSLACILPALTAGESLDLRFGVKLLAWTALGLGGYTLLWLALRRWIERPKKAAADMKSISAAWLLRGQVFWMLSAVALLAVWAAAGVVGFPDRLPPWGARLGGPLSYASWLLALTAVLWYAGRRWQLWAMHAAIGFLLAAGAFAAVSAGNRTVATDWPALHVLSACWLGVAAIAAALACWATLAERRSEATTRFEPATLNKPAVIWSTIVGSLVVLLALRGAGADPWSWWPAALTIAVAVVWAAMGMIRRRAWLAYASTSLVVVATTLLWIGLWPAAAGSQWIDLVEINLIALALAGVVWLAVEIYMQRRKTANSANRPAAVPVHHTIAIGVTLVWTGWVVLGLLSASTGRFFGVTQPLDISTLGAVAVVVCLGALLLASLWERSAWYALPSLYLWGVALLAVGLDQWEDQPLFGPLVEQTELRPSFTLLAAGLAMAAQVAVSGHLWMWGLNLARLGSKLGVPLTVIGLERTVRWLPVVSLVVAAPIVSFELTVVLSFQTAWMRAAAAFAPALLAYGFACMAQQRRRGLMKFLSLSMLGLTLVLLGWADMPPEWSSTLVLGRAIRLLIALAILTFAYGAGVPFLRRVVQADWLSSRSDWSRAIRRVATTCGAAAIGALLLVLVLEVAYFDPQTGALDDPFQIGAVAVVLVLLVIGLLTMALSPDRDPLALSETGRMGYVYGAQVVAALLFAHLYLAMPQLFDGLLRPYWPYIVMAIAFAAVAAGELLGRSGIRVLADPLHRTSAFLPLLPALGFWVVAAQQTHYATLLFTVGLLYVLISMLHRSLVSSLAAALAGNGAIWALLTDHQFSILHNPQLWLIPPALSVLVASQINRRRLTDGQLTGLRYMSIVVIYLSATGEMFIAGVGESIWQPIVLASLSVAGVLLGIAMRVRAFLYLGTGFLLLSLVSMVWHAYRQLDHVGVWWAFGIALGLLILALFGLFEKKRPELMQLIQRLRQWEQ